MKLLRLIFLLILTLPAAIHAQPVTLEKARALYFSMSTEKCNSLKLAELFEKNKPGLPVLKAYNGAASAAAPECVTNPATKISWFRKGKTLLDNAAAADPSNFEIRFLRFATQDKAPGFLGYNDNLEEDKKYLISNLSKGRGIVKDDQVFRMMTGFLLKSKSLNQTEKKIVNDYSSNLN